MRVGGMEDFMTLVRVYYQACMAAQVGITNLGALPDLRVFKQTLKVPTINNKLGVGEKKRCRQMLQEVYGLSDNFFNEADASLRKRCRTINEVQSYFGMFQGFSQELMMLMGNVMKWKMRLPNFMAGALKGMTEKSIHQIMTKSDWKDESVRRACVNVRHYQQQLQYSEAWMTEYVHTVVMLAKKEPKKAIDK